MTTTAVIVGTTAASVAYTTSITADRAFAAFGLATNEVIDIEIKDSSGAYHGFNYIDEGGHPRRAQLTAYNNMIVLKAGDVRFNKPVTVASVEVVEYT